MYFSETSEQLYDPKLMINYLLVHRDTEEKNQF